MMFLTNVLSPAMAGVFFLFYALYFFQIPQGSVEGRSMGFPYYLLGFGVFLLTRPLQLMMGPHPWPLVIVCLRFMLLCGFCSPMVLWSALSISRRSAPIARLFMIGAFLGVIYVAFTVLGTPSSNEFFRLGDLIAYDNHTPAMLGPWYAREVTQVIQVLTGGLFHLVAALFALRESNVQKRLNRPYRQLLWFGLGTLIFGTAFIVGSIFKAWWLYYLATVPSAILMGFAVLADIRLLSRRVDRLMPFLREELFHALSSGADDEDKLKALMDLLGKRELPDTVLVVDQKLSESGEAMLDAHERTEHALLSVLENKFRDEFLFLTIGSGRFAVCLSTTTGDPSIVAKTLFEHAMGKTDRPFVMGLGRAYSSTNIRQSYLEALSAVRIAREQELSVVSFQEIMATHEPSQYPHAERDEFLQEIRNGHVPSAQRRFDVYWDRLQAFCDRDPTMSRNRLNELLGMIVSVALDSGADATQTFQLSSMTQSELNRLKKSDDLRDCLKRAIENLPKHSFTTVMTDDSPVEKVKTYIAGALEEDIPLERAAKKVGVSPSHLQRLLQKEELTFTGLVSHARISKARELLTGNDTSITDIAFLVGFRDSNYFSTVFKKHEGMTPRQFRKEARG